MIKGNPSPATWEVTMTATLDILRTESSDLISIRVSEQAQTARLNRAIREAIVKAGVSIDAASEATGVAPVEIYRILETPVEIEDLDVLTGVA
jgi:hypothetical protein